MSLPFSLSGAFESLSLSASKRTFSTTRPAQKLPKMPDYIPPYPHGPNYVYRQANTGLYGGATIQFGNKISQGRNQGKTRRSWRPNVRRKKLWSEALQEGVFIKITRKSLRTIRKSGGLDNYLLDDRPGRIKELGVFGWKLRYQVMQTEKIQEQFREERKRLGLPEPPTFEEWLKQKQEKDEASLVEGVKIESETKPTYNGRNY